MKQTITLLFLLLLLGGGKTWAEGETTLLSVTFDNCNGTGGNDNLFTAPETQTKLNSNYTQYCGDGVTEADNAYLVAYQCAICNGGTKVIKFKTLSSSSFLNASAKLTFRVAPMADNSMGNIKVSATNATYQYEGETSSKSNGAELQTNILPETGQWKSYTVNLTQITGDVTITIKSSYFFLDDVTVVTAKSPVTIQPKTLNLKVGESERPTIIAYADLTGEQLYGKSYTLTSNNTDVATIQSQGHTIEAVGEGTTTVTVSFAGDDENLSATGTITVNVSPRTTDLSQFEYNLDDVYLSDGNGTGKFINSSTIEYDETYNKLRLKLVISPDLIELGENATFTVTSSNTNVIGADGVAVWKAANERIYVGNFTVNAVGTSTISVKFNGNDDYNEQTITQEFTVVEAIQPVLSYQMTSPSTTIDNVEYPTLQIKTGGATGMLALQVSPESIRDQVTYSWAPLESDGVMSSSSLITIDENGVVTTANKKGRALVTATYRNASASYVVNVVISESQAGFKYGDNILFEYYDGCVYKNPLEHYGSNNTLTWSSSDETIATVETNPNDKYKDGQVTVYKAGTVTVTATVTTPNNETQNFSYTLTLKEASNKYTVYKGQTPTVGETVTSVDGITMTYGGFTDNFGDGSSHTYNQPGTTDSKTDKFNSAISDENGLQPENYYFTNGNEDPRYESTDNSGNIRGWERIRVLTDFLSKTIPVYGNYFQFEPEMDGTLTVNVLQTGSIQDISQSARKNHDIYTKWGIQDEGIIYQWNYKALYLTDERGLTVRATNKASHSTYAHPYIHDEVADKEINGETTSFPSTYRDLLSLKPHILGTGLDGTTSYSNYTYKFIYGKTTANDGSTITGESTSTKIKKELATAFGLTTTAPTEEDYVRELTTDNVVHIMENERYGYWTLTQSNSVYSFPVKAGKTYFLYTDGSKLGLNSFSFTPDNNTLTSTLTIDGADSETTATTMGAKSNCTVTLNRKLIKGQPNTLTLPFSVSVKKVKEVFGEGTQVLHVKSIDNNIHFVRHHHQMIVAGEPCIIYPTNETKQQWVFENVTVEDPGLFEATQYVPVSSDDYTFTGCFENKTMPAGSYYVSAKAATTQTTNGQDVYIYRVSTEDWMSNTRAFFKNTSGDSANELTSAIAFNAVEEDGSSIIDGIRLVGSENQPASAAPEGIYNLNGQKVNGESLRKGIYIIQGRKVVIR